MMKKIDNAIAAANGLTLHSEDELCQSRDGAYYTRTKFVLITTDGKSIISFRDRRSALAYLDQLEAGKTRKR